MKWCEYERCLVTMVHIEYGAQCTCSESRAQCKLAAVLVVYCIYIIDEMKAVFIIVLIMPQQHAMELCFSMTNNLHSKPKTLMIIFK